MKRRISLLLAVVMILGSFSFAFANDAMTEAEAGAFLKDKGVLQGINGELKLEDKLRREDAVVMVARLHGAEEEAEAFPTTGLTFKDVKDPYYQSMIAWAVANNLFEGHNAEKFGYHEDITAQHYATVLLRALGYDKEVADKAGYDKALELAAELGLLEGVKVENKTPITRGQMAVMTYNALGTKMKDSNDTLAKKLEIEMPRPAVLEVEEVKADNLKEIKVVFNRDVDEDVVTNLDFYETDAGEIENAFVENGNVLVLALKGKMNNKAEKSLTIKGISEEVDKAYTFRIYDNAIPEVEAVEALGTKTIKVTMSEPVKDTKVSNFKLNDKTIYGKINVSGRNVYITPYSRLAVGEYTLTVLPLEDHAGFKSVERKVAFEVLEDTVKPSVVDLTATLEKVTLVFDKDIDPDIAGKVYWKSGATNKVGKVEGIYGNKVVVDFADKALPVYQTTLYVENFTDYSGNKMENAKLDVKATIDEQRPVVLKAELNDDNNGITVKFNKVIKEGTFTRKNVVLKDSKDKVISVKDVKKLDARTFEIELYGALKEGVYDLTVIGVRDNTLLENVMEEYNTKLEVVDESLPKVDTVSGNGRRIHITFSKAMDAATLDNVNSYIFEIGTGDKAETKVIKGLDFDIPSGNKSVIITLPEDYAVKDGKNPVYRVAVVGAKTADGLPLSNLGKYHDITTGNVEVVYEDGATAAIAKNKIKVTFNQAIEDVYTDAFEIGAEIKSIEANLPSNEITLVLKKELKADDSYKTMPLTIAKSNRIKFVSGNEVKGAINYEDGISPSVEKVTAEGKFINVKFDEAINAINADRYARDLTVIRQNGTKTLVADRDYVTTVVNNNTIRIELLAEKEAGSYYTIQVKDAEFIADLNENLAKDSDAEEVWVKYEKEEKKEVVIESVKVNNAVTDWTKNSVKVSVEEYQKEAKVGEVSASLNVPVKVKSVTTKIGPISEADLKKKLEELKIEDKFAKEFKVTLDKTFGDLDKFSPTTVVVVDEKGNETTFAVELEVHDARVTWEKGKEGKFNALTNSFMGTLNIPETFKDKEVAVKVLDKDGKEVETDKYEYSLNEDNVLLVKNFDNKLFGKITVQILVDGEVQEHLTSTFTKIG